MAAEQFKGFVYRAFWHLILGFCALLLSIATAGVAFIYDMSRNVSDLNARIGALFSTIQSKERHDEQQDEDHRHLSERVRFLEMRKTR